MQVERDRLWRVAVPRLQQFCTDHSLTFLLVDLPSDLHQLRHSVTSSVTSPAAEADWVKSLRSTELARCLQQSLGPDFVVRITGLHICVNEFAQRRLFRGYFYGPH